jgi:hypothetical protein
MDPQILLDNAFFGYFYFVGHALGPVISLGLVALIFGGFIFYFIKNLTKN